MDLMELPNFKIILSVFILGFVVFSLWSKFISPKVELYRKEKLLIELGADHVDVLAGLARIDEGFLGWQTLSDGGIASFSAQAKERLNVVENRLKFWQKKSVSDDLKKLTDLNYETLLKAKGLLNYFNNELNYLSQVEPILMSLKEDVEGLGSKSYSKIIEKPELIGTKREDSERFSRMLTAIEVSQDLEEFNKQLKKTVRAQVDFWANNEIAVERRTPTIYSQSFWVLKRDWEMLAEIGERDLDIKRNEEFQRMKREFEERLNVMATFMAP